MQNHHEEELSGPLELMAVANTVAPIVGLIILLAVVVFALSGCGSSKQIERVERHAPAADMVRLDPHLPAQTDPSLGGIFQGYVNAAQQYRACVDLHNELQDFVESSTCTAKQ